MRYTRSARGERGQALPEFALVLPIFALMLLGVIQIGMVFGAQNALANGVREATRYASTVPVSNISDVGTCSAGRVSNVYSRLVTVLQQKLPGFRAANLRACTPTSPNTTVLYCIRENPRIDSNATRTWSIFVQIRATYEIPIYFPIVGDVLGAGSGKLPATQTEQMRVETYPLSGPYLGGFATCS